MTIRDRIKEFVRVPADAIEANPKNWRNHGAFQRTSTEAILAEVGFADALIAYKPKGARKLRLIDGHLRRDIMGEETVPVLVLDVTDEEADKILATLDPLAALADMDSTKLDELLKTLKTDSPDLAALMDRLRNDVNVALLAAAGGAIAGDVDPDDIPAPPDKASTCLGDIWILGDHRLMCGDSGSEPDLDRLLDGQKIHLVNTDPPYNVKVEPRSNNAIAAGLSSFTADSAASKLKRGEGNAASFGVDHTTGKAKRPATHKKLRAKDRPLANDFVSDAAFDKMLHEWFGNIARVLVPGGGFYIWGGYANCGNYPPVLKELGLYFSQAVIWVKEHPVLTRKDFMGNHEWCFYGWREGAGHRWFGPTNAVDVWHVKKVNPQSMIHLTEKPVELAVRAIQFSSQQGENVLDLFGGSGSTLIGAEQTMRHAFLMELDPLYCDVIVERWQKFTGRKARRVKGKSTAKAAV